MNDEPAIDALVRLGEAAYDRMYDARDARAAAVEYSDCKDYFRDAIRMAHAAGLTQRVVELESRLAHIKAVFRSQFA
ncbi:MAG TPA: hypothetical protein VFF06_31680 [Polyangia bacterium]|nr:hypothetical protein [Polyangia bacterium]